MKNLEAQLRVLIQRKRQLTKRRQSTDRSNPTTLLSQSLSQESLIFSPKNYNNPHYENNISSSSQLQLKPSLVFSKRIRSPEVASNSSLMQNSNRMTSQRTRFRKQARHEQIPVPDNTAKMNFRKHKQESSYRNIVSPDSKPYYRSLEQSEGVIAASRYNKNNNNIPSFQQTYRKDTKKQEIKKQLPDDRKAQTDIEYVKEIEERNRQLIKQIQAWKLRTTKLTGILKAVRSAQCSIETQTPPPYDSEHPHKQNKKSLCMVAKTVSIRIGQVSRDRADGHLTSLHRREKRDLSYLKFVPSIKI